MTMLNEKVLRQLGWTFNESFQRWELWRGYTMEGWINKKLLTPTTHDFGNGPVPAHKHCNGGGWVANTAKVADTVYVGINAQVFAYAQVLGGVKIFDNVKIGGHARINGDITFLGEARIFSNVTILSNAK